jgi:hypothetical protein
VSAINEHVVLLGTGANRETVLAAIEDAGGWITHRLSRDAWIVNLDRGEADVENTMDAGHPALINNNWPPFPT